MKRKSTNTDKKINRYVAKMKQSAKTITASSSTSKSFLLSTGIYTANGNLKQAYK